MTVSQMLDSMDSRELMEWRIFDSLEPIGAARQDLQAAVIASTVAGAAGVNLPFDKFVLDFDFKPEKTEEEKDQELANQIRQGFAGLVKRK